jgi:sulfate adenylyltransferase subunit 2
MSYELTHLDVLEAEALHIIREVGEEFARPAVLFSGGKDSAVLLHLAAKALWPRPMRFAVLHVDTGHNFPEVLAFRDRVVAALGAEMIVARVDDAIAEGRVEEASGSRNRLQSRTLLDAITAHGFDAALGGGRRDEDRARAKERVYSVRAAGGGWEPHLQRPELWQLYNGRIRAGEHVRVFPLSNWTELDVWEYIAAEQIEVPSLYFAHSRQVFVRDGMLLAAAPCVARTPAEVTFEDHVRYRTVGDMTCTGAVRSRAQTLDEVIDELARVRVSERGQTRADDRMSVAAMEDRKREGYF